MNANEIFKCDLCGSITHCRIAFSGRKEQLFRYVCKRCSSPIDVTLQLDYKNISWNIIVNGATKLRKFDSSRADFFADLSIDFPTFNGDYEMGNTPFLRACRVIGLEKIQIFQLHLRLLDYSIEKSRDINSLIKLYIDENWHLYEKLVRKYLPESDVPCVKIVDKNRWLYFLVEKFFLPLIQPEDNIEFVNKAHEELDKIYKKSNTSFFDFLKEIIATNFLKELQKDCLEIYPRILESELILRPALFCDFVDNKIIGQIPTKISVSSFDNYKDLFKDISEITSRLLVLVAGVSNLKLRGNHNNFDQTLKNSPKNLEEFVDVPFGKKLDFVDDIFWKDIAMQVTDNKLRNSIAHYKTEYDDISQIIVYYPKLEGFKRNEKEEVTFLEFACNILNKFRWLHRLHHLVKMLYVFYYLTQDVEK